MTGETRYFISLTAGTEEDCETLLKKEKTKNALLLGCLLSQSAIKVSEYPRETTEVLKRQWRPEGGF